VFSLRRGDRAVRLLAVNAAWLLSACAPMTNLLHPASPAFEGRYATPAIAPRATAPIRIVTFNIKFSQEVDRAITVLGGDSLRGADVVALQEMDEVAVERIARARGLNYAYYPAAFIPPTGSTLARQYSRAGRSSGAGRCCCRTRGGPAASDEPPPRPWCG
jgi:endonuclease/exonuclease/phosphatase (EEP) superfamily protein YafD